MSTRRALDPFLNIVGAGGNSGAVGFGMGFRQLDYESAFVIMGAFIMGSAVLSIFINIKGHRSSGAKGHSD
jgi:NNP family nitrate/nitrite transporter-like MFS transporter